MISRCLLGCSVLLLASVAYGSGAFQRTKDGKTLIWNNAPEPGDIAAWSGERDSNGYATGYGTLTWYRADMKMSVGSNLPSPGQRILIGRYSGQMVRGKFQGMVVNVDPDGRTFHGTFAKGKKTNDWTRGGASPNQSQQQKTSETKKTEPPVAGPSPSPSHQEHVAASSGRPETAIEKSTEKGPQGSPVKEKKTADQTSELIARREEQKNSEPRTAEKPAEGPGPSPQLEGAKISPEPSAIPTKTPIVNTLRRASVNVREEGESTGAPPPSGKRNQQNKAEPKPAEPPVEAAGPNPNPQRRVAMVSPRPSPVPGEVSVSLAPETNDSDVQNRVIQHFKEQTQSTLSRVGDATDNFREVNRLDSLPKLPAPVSEGVASLINRARNVRSEVGSETALQECRNEIQTVDALSVVDQVTRDMAANDASRASSKLNDFLQDNSEAVDDNQKVLWRYLASLQQLFNRSEKEAASHIQRGQALDAANKTNEAIREYQKAYQVFPNPATAEKIRHLQDNSLGL